MPVKPPSVILSECLQDRNVTVKSSHLLKDVDTGGDKSFKTWIMDTVDSKTLLTKEELNLYAYQYHEKNYMLIPVQI